MEKKIIFLISAIITTTMLILIVLFYPSPQYSQLGCETLIENSNPTEAINTVFISNLDKSELNKYTKLFFETYPFSENKEKFNFYYIQANTECEIFQNSAILCYSRNLIKLSANCPNDFVVAIEDQTSNIRSSAYMNVISINSKHSASVFLHEFGHVFATLADEYTPANIPKGSKNCASKESFTQNFEGCSKENYFRSSPASLMRTLSSNSYDELNEKIIKEKIEQY